MFQLHLMDILFLLIGLLIGGLLVWLYASQKRKEEHSIPFSELESKYVKKEFLDEEKRQNESRETEIRGLHGKLARAEQLSEDLRIKLEEQKTEVAQLQEQFRTEMKNLSQNILEEKSKRFLELNEKRVGEILNPLKERLQHFEEKVDKSSKESLQWNAALREQVKGLAEANSQMSEDAKRLTSALKGDKKLQGNWGEVQLEMILEKAGLEKDTHYRKEVSLEAEDGQKFRPDFIINLPEGKHLVIDSKVSLIAYDTFYSSEDDLIRNKALNEHTQALAQHIISLGNKNYQKLVDINPPDYVLMFVPIEPALNIALQSDPNLFEKALAKNIVMVSTSTLLATLRTISYIWKQENQRKNVVEIARESGALYDKFVGFMEDLIGIGKKLDGVKKDYSGAMNKLFESHQKGGTIIGRIERIKKLGADTSKQIPQNLIDRAGDTE